MPIFLWFGSKYNKMTHIHLVWGVVGKDLGIFLEIL
jgi:hypothetical protein